MSELFCCKNGNRAIKAAPSETEARAKGKDTPEQMIIADDLWDHLEDIIILALDLEWDKEELQLFKCRCQLRTTGTGRREDMNVVRLLKHAHSLPTNYRYGFSALDDI